MERGEYERLAAVEERMWWFRGLHANLLAAWREAGRAAAQPDVLDVGCGTGGLLKRLVGEFPVTHAFGLDLDAGAAATAWRKSACPVCVGDAAALPFADRAFDAIFSADVLCHRGVDEAAALGSFRRCLKPGGMLVLNLPAYRWLYSAHDRAVDNARRYGRRDIRALLQAAGFAGVRMRYWNSLLFPLMLLRRKLKPVAAAHPASDVALLWAPLERLFSAVVAVEGKLLAWGVSLPFGGSILTIAMRP
jgi:SAM-dependent methyltransferase